jgi:hypothetical protein
MGESNGTRTLIPGRPGKWTPPPYPEIPGIWTLPGRLSHPGRWTPPPVSRETMYWPSSCQGHWDKIKQPISAHFNNTCFLHQHVLLTVKLRRAIVANSRQLLLSSRRANPRSIKNKQTKEGPFSDFAPCCSRVQKLWPSTPAIAFIPVHTNLENIPYTLIGRRQLADAHLVSWGKHVL